MWKTYKKSIDSFGRWTLMQGPRGPFCRVHRQLQFCCTVSSAASLVCDLRRPESCYLIVTLFPLLPPLPFPNVLFFPRVHRILCSCSPCPFPGFVDDLSLIGVF